MQLEHSVCMSTRIEYRLTKLEELTGLNLRKTEDRLAGARVIATTGSDEKFAAARELGADEVINYELTNVGEAVMRLTDGLGVDLAHDMVGGNRLLDCIAAVGQGGRIVSVGAHAGERVEIDMIELFRKHVSLHGCGRSTRAIVAKVLALVAAGRLRPVRSGHGPSIADRPMIPRRNSELGRQWQMRLLDEADDLKLLRCGEPHVCTPPGSHQTFNSKFFNGKEPPSFIHTVAKVRQHKRIVLKHAALRSFGDGVNMTAPTLLAPRRNRASIAIFVPHGGGRRSFFLCRFVFVRRTRAVSRLI